MFYRALAFNRDLGRWDTSAMAALDSAWQDFSRASALRPEHRPPGCVDLEDEDDWDSMEELSDEEM